MTVKRFEDLEIWQLARILCKKIRALSLTTTLKNDFSIKDQILSSSGSVMDNIAEGFERDGRKEFINFLYISKASLGETRSQVHRSYDAGHFKKIFTMSCLMTVLIFHQKISHFIDYLYKCEYEGLKKKSRNPDTTHEP